MRLIFIFVQVFFFLLRMVFDKDCSSGYLHNKSISGRVDKASATETVDSGSIPRRVKPKTIKLAFTASLLDVQQLKGQCVASAVCGRRL